MKKNQIIPYSRQDLNRKDIDAVTKVLSSDFLTQGPTVPKFENKLIEITQSKYATAVNSASSALHIACLALGVKRGDIVWTVPNTFVASANCALHCGAKIDFVDIDLNTHNICIESLKNKLKSARNASILPKVLIPVHFAGEPCDMALINELAIEFNFKVIEDASHAIGGKYRDKPIGACEFSDITVFSFHAVKIITTGEGGALLTNCEEIDQKLKMLRSHGITRDQNLMEFPNSNFWYYEQIYLGFNYRMTDIHAALGLSQLSRLKKFIFKRHLIAKNYDNKLINSNIKIPYRSDKNLSAFHLYVIQVEIEKQKILIDALLKENIKANLHYIPLHTHPYYKKLGFNWGDFPNSEIYSKKAISLPMNTTLKLDQQNLVIDVVKSICDE